MSGLPFELLVALRYLRPKRTFVSIITLISIIGVSLGVAVLIIVISVMSGFDKEMRDKILGFNAHLRIMQVNLDTGNNVPMADYKPILDKVNANPRVEGAAPFAAGRVMLETERPDTEIQAVEGPMLRGMDTGTNATSGMILSNIVAGTPDLSGDGILVGEALAGSLHLKVGDRVAVLSPYDFDRIRKALAKKEDFVPTPKDFGVKGIFDAGYYEFNANLIAISMENFQDLYQLDDSVHGILIMLKNPYEASRVRADLVKSLGRKDLTISTWEEENNIMLAVLVEKNVMLYILFFIVIVAAFGITCTEITFVVLKTREIGVMKALGASSRQVLWLFMSQSLTVSIMGVLTGLGGGLLALHYRNEFLHLMRRVTGFELFPANIYNFTELPALIVPGDLVVICGGSLLICLAAAAFPARHASKLKPVEALRHD
jgi:lipoprotein-releasing system permease protein